MDFSKRLSFTEAKKHPFFQGINWKNVVDKLYNPPFKNPKKKNDTLQEEVISSITVLLDTQLHGLRL